MIHLVLATAMMLCGQTTVQAGGCSGALAAQGDPVFSPAPGTYATTQNVTITCPAGKSAFYRTDGNTAETTIASTLYTGPISVSSTTTISAICATMGAYQSNTQASGTGWVCNTLAGGSFSGPPSVTCASSGGVIGTPSNVVMSFPGGASPATLTITAPASQSGQTQALFPFLAGGNAFPSAPTCDTCTEQVKDITFTVVGSGLANQEFDSPQFDFTHGINRQNGTQCEGSSGKIEVDSGNAGGWTLTTASCSNWTNGTTHEEINRIDHVNGDTGCGGSGCANYKYIIIDGTNTTLLGNYSGTQGYNTTTNKAWGWQFQPDLSPTGGSAVTAGWTVASATVALGFGDESSQVSGTYTISASATATPVLGPFAVTNMTGNTANYSPTSGTTGLFAGCAGTNPCLPFGKQLIHTASMAIPITVNNCSNSLLSQCSGTGSMAVTGMSISGTNASDFTLSGTTSGTITSGSSISPTITFTPSTSAAESATLTVNYTGATVSSQTMSLTGTGLASATALSACGTSFAASTNYYLTANVSATASCFTNNVAGVDLNLNGHTITFCSAGGTTLVGGIISTNFNEKNAVYHNGTITEAAGKTCTGLTGTLGYGSAPFIVTSLGSSSQAFGNSYLNLNLSTNEAPGNDIFEEYAGVTTTSFSTFYNMNMTLNGVFNCSSGNVGCRSADQFYAVVEDQVQNAAPFLAENVGQTGGTQGGLAALSPGSTVSYTLFAPGNASAGNSNGFAIQSWFTGTVTHNLEVGSFTGGSILARGGQLASVNGTLTGANISNNACIATQIANNGEYGGCQLGGGYCFQLNTVGNGHDLSANTVSNNFWRTITGVCEAYAFSDSGSTIGSGTNNITSNHIEADIDPGTYVSGNAAAGIRLDSCQYSPCPANAITFTGNTILGDTADIFVLNTNTRSFLQNTFGKGTNPIGGQLFMDFNHGFNTGNGDGLITIVDPTFLNGVTKSSNNLSTWATNNPSFTASYIVDWTYIVTVQKSSNSAPISGAAVTITPANSGTICSTTTNGSGVATCILPDTLYRSVTGTYSTVNYNPMGISISASGCSTYTNSETITATTAETKQLSGC